MKELYDDIFREFEEGDESDKAKTVYASFGLAVYLAQCLEKTFENMLIAKRLANEEINSSQEAIDICDQIEQSKKTMGNLLHEVKNGYQIDEADLGELFKLLNIRNQLAHKYFKENSTKFFTDSGKRAMIKYFTNFCKRYKIIDKKLERYYEAYKLKIGLTEEKIEELMQEMIEEEKAMQ